MFIGEGSDVCVYVCVFTFVGGGRVGRMLCTCEGVRGSTVYVWLTQRHTKTHSISPHTPANHPGICAGLDVHPCTNLEDLNANNALVHDDADEAAEDFGNMTLYRGWVGWGVEGGWGVCAPSTTKPSTH